MLLKNIFKGRSSNSLPFQKQSYSQCGEDLIVKYIFDCIEIQCPSYIDIGAHHPFYLSNTALFYLLGSRGVNIEPDSSLFQTFLLNRKEDINLNIGIGDSEGKLNFYIMTNQVLNTLSLDEATQYTIENPAVTIKKVVEIDVLPLTKIIRDYCNNTFPDFLTVDAEGLDEKIIYSLDYNGSVPTVICVETISYSEKGLGRKNRAIIEFLNQKGYMVYADTYINTIFVKNDRWIK